MSDPLAFASEFALYALNKLVEIGAHAGAPFEPIAH
jgi:hypothetical protein